MRTRPTIQYNPPFSVAGFSHCRWIENVHSGLREVGFADRLIAGIRHKGWYTTDDGWSGEVYRGQVFRLPSRTDGPRFAFGFADPNVPGSALLCFDFCDSVEDAARWADRFAEIMAEREREYAREEDVA